MGFPGSSVLRITTSVEMQEIYEFDNLGQADPLWKEMADTPLHILLGDRKDREEQGYRPWGLKESRHDWAYMHCVFCLLWLSLHPQNVLIL